MEEPSERAANHATSTKRKKPATMKKTTAEEAEEDEPAPEKQTPTPQKPAPHSEEQTPQEPAPQKPEVAIVSLAILEQPYGAMEVLQVTQFAALGAMEVLQGSQVPHHPPLH